MEELPRQRSGVRLLQGGGASSQSNARRFVRGGRLDVSSGPRSDKGCTDKLCCLLFLIAWAGFVLLGFVGFKEGHPKLLSRFIHGRDLHGKTCGEGDRRKWPLTYFTVPMGYDPAGPNSTHPYVNWTHPRLQDLKPVCTLKCPEGGQAGKVVEREQSLCPPEMQALKLCTWYGGNEVSEVAQFCFDPHLFGEASSMADDWQVQIRNMATAWWVLALMAPVAAVAGYSYLSVVRTCGTCCIWLLLLGLIASLGCSGYYVFLHADHLADLHGARVEHVKGVAYVFWGIGWLVLLVSVCFCKTIQTCIEMIKTTSLFLSEIKSQMLQPVLFAIAHVVVYVAWVGVAVYVITIDMEEEAISENGESECFKAKNPFCVKWTTNKHYFCMGYLVFFLFWIVNWLHACSQHSTARAVGVWYFAPLITSEGQQIKSFPGGSHSLCSCSLMLSSICIGVFKHGGSLAFGSLVCLLAELLRLILPCVKVHQEDGGNPVSECCSRGLLCVTDHILLLIRVVSRQAYVQVALVGTDFCESCRNAYSMAIRHPGRFLLVSRISFAVGLIGQLFVVSLTTFVAYLILTQAAEHPGFLPSMSSPLGPLIAVGLGSWIISEAILHQFSIAAIAVMHCFVADEEMALAAGELGSLHAPGPLRKFVGETCVQHDVALSGAA